MKLVTEKKESKEKGKLLTALDGAGRSVHNFRKAHKGWFIAIIVVLALALAALIISLIGSSNPATKQADMLKVVRTTVLEKTTLDDTVSVTGTVKSGKTSNITTVLKYTVKSINVQVGDNVNEGDVVVTLDTADLEKQLKKAQESLSDNISRAKTTYDEAKSAYEKACAAEQTALTASNSAYTTYAAAKKVYDRAVADVQLYTQEYNTAVTYQTDAQAGLASISNELKTAFKNCVHAHTISDAPAFGSYTDCACKDRYDNSTYPSKNGTLTGWVEINDYLTAANAEAEAKLTALDAKKNEVNFAASENAYNSASAAYTKANAEYESAKATTQSRESSLKTAYNNLQDAQSGDTITDLKEQIEKCTLTAQTSGKVTALNATVGSLCEGTVATIQDTDNLYIDIDIAEYDVKNVEIGMDCRITSDATDEEIPGVVTMVSPTANASTGMGGGSSSSSTFDAEVTVKNGANGLLVGMNAKVEIILSSVDNVFSVPSDAVGVDENGNKVVYVQTGSENGNMVFEPYVVSTGQENDYYTEISASTLKEGMVIRASANADEAVSDVVSEQGMFGFSMSDGRPSGGGMPSGGGPTGGGGPNGG